MMDEKRHTDIDLPMYWSPIQIRGKVKHMVVLMDTVLFGALLANVN